MEELNDIKKEMENLKWKEEDLKRREALVKDKEFNQLRHALLVLKTMDRKAMKPEIEAKLTELVEKFEAYEDS